MVDIIQEDLAYTARANRALDSHISHHNVQMDMESFSFLPPTLPAIVDKASSPKVSSRQKKDNQTRLESIQIIGVPLLTTDFLHRGSAGLSSDRDRNLGTTSTHKESDEINELKSKLLLNKAAVSPPPTPTPSELEQDQVSICNLTLDLKKTYDLLKPPKVNFWDQYQAKLNFEAQRARMRHADIFCSKTSMRYLASKRNKMKRKEPETNAKLPQIVGQKIKI